MSPICSRAAGVSCCVRKTLKRRRKLWFVQSPSSIAYFDIQLPPAQVEIMRRKQSAQHFDTRQQLVLENAYYQCNPPERVQREQVQLTPVEAFIEHLLHDVLMKKTVDKVLKLLRKLHWEDAEVSPAIMTSQKLYSLSFVNIGLRKHPEGIYRDLGTEVWKYSDGSNAGV
jgi:hypothetical protein